MKAKNSLLRVENLINADRIKSSDGFLELLTEDIDRVFREYFDYNGHPSVEVVKNGGGFSVDITLNARGIRTFSRLPNER
nr:hypothetical protein [Clostridia bacterium]